MGSAARFFRPMDAAALDSVWWTLGKTAPRISHAPPRIAMAIINRPSITPQSIFSWNGNFMQSRSLGTAPRQLVPYGVRISPAYKEAKASTRKSAVRARKLEEEKGLLLDPRKCLQMELKRNSGVGWYRSMQVIKHLEMHKRGKGPPIDARMRDKITQIVTVLKKGK